MKWFRKEPPVLVLRLNPEMPRERMLEAFAHAMSSPLFKGVRECIARMEYELTEEAAELAKKGQYELAGQRMQAVDVLRELEKDLMGWVEAAKQK